MKIKGSVSGKSNLCDGDGENHSSERLPCFLLFYKIKTQELE